MLSRYNSVQIVPRCGASHLRSEFRGSSREIVPRCGASHLRSEFRGYRYAFSRPEHVEDASDQPTTRLADVTRQLIGERCIGDALTAHDIVRRNVLGPNPAREVERLLVLVDVHHL